MFLVLFASPLLLAGCGRQARTEGPDVLLVVLDAVRADHLGCYGYGRDTSPCLDSLAGTGTVFTAVQSQTSWTMPSAATILTGMSPRGHGCRAGADRVYGLDPATPTLATVLHDAGYATFGCFSSAWFSAGLGFDAGFDTFICYVNEGHQSWNVAESFRGWIDSLPREERWFAMVHLYEAHEPYSPPEPYDTMFVSGRVPWPDDSLWMVGESGEVLRPEQLASLTARYDGEIRFQDAAIGTMLAAVRSSGRADDVLVIVTADHGEEFLKHGGCSHGKTLFQEVLWIPLIASGPGIQLGAERTDLAASMDIMPTILARAGIPVPGGVEGVDLSAGPCTDRYVPSSEPKRAALVSIRRGDLVLIRDMDTGADVMYDLSADPSEACPLPPDSVLLLDLADYLAVRPGRERATAGESELDGSLRDLGYVR